MRFDCYGPCYGGSNKPTTGVTTVGFITGSYDNISVINWLVKITAKSKVVDSAGKTVFDPAWSLTTQGQTLFRDPATKPTPARYLCNADVAKLTVGRVSALAAELVGAGLWVRFANKVLERRRKYVG
jgi:hypothetical protein